MESKEYEKVIQSNEKIAKDIAKGVCKACGLNEKKIGSIGAVLKDIVDIYVILNTDPGDNECWLGAIYKIPEKILIVCIDFHQKIEGNTKVYESLIDKYQNTFKGSLLQPELLNYDDERKAIRFSKKYEEVERKEIASTVEITIKDYLKKEHDVVLDDLYNELANERHKEKRK